MARDVVGLRKGEARIRPAADAAMSHMHLNAFAILAACGFQGSSAHACHVVAEIMQRYMALLARTATTLANEAGRATVNLWDISMAMEEVMGAGSMDELLEWAHDEGIWKRSTNDIWPASVQALQTHLGQFNTAVPSKTMAEPIPMSYRPADVGVEAELEVRQAVDECLEEDLVWQEAAYLATPSSPSTSSPPTPTDAPTYIPSFLPPLPRLDRGPTPPPKAESPPPPTSASTSTKDVPIRPTPRAISVQGVPPAEEVCEDGVRRVWRRPADVYAGVLAESQEARSDFPSLEKCMQCAKSTPLSSNRSTTSSLDAFMHAMDAMADDPVTRSPVYLTSLARSHHANPTSTSSMNAAYKRRRLAHSIADPLRYVPNDSIHGCVDVHPTAPATAPGPSLLITIPPAKDGVDEETHAATAAPIFTPVHPQGRDISLVPPAGGQFPILGYRHASHLYHGARMLMYPDMQRVFSRLEDPPAVLDDHHTEQVYHGTAASRTMLTGTMMSVRHRDTPSVMVSRYRGANSILHASLERLRFHLAAQMEAARRAAQAEGHVDEVEEPIRGERIKMPVKGTLVHSWDWRKADPWASS